VRIKDRAAFILALSLRGRGAPKGWKGAREQRREQVLLTQSSFNKPSVSLVPVKEKQALLAMTDSTERLEAGVGHVASP
jgi:hypothetical protein